MSNTDVVFSRIMLSNLRAEAKKAKVKIPKNMTCLKSMNGWWLVEADGFRREVVADNAYDARCKVISRMIAERTSDEAIIDRCWECTSCRWVNHETTTRCEQCEGTTGRVQP